jgi:hypothetical protein
MLPSGRPELRLALALLLELLVQVPRAWGHNLSCSPKEATPIFACVSPLLDLGALLDPAVWSARIGSFHFFCCIAT